MLNELISTTNTYQKSPLSIVYSEEPDETHSSENGKQKASDGFIQSNSDYIVDLIGNIEQIKRYAQEILHHNRSTIELRSDGSIVITPHPLQLPNEIISLIIQHLTEQQQTLFECTLISKQFHTIVNPLLWKAPSFANDDISRCFLTCLSHTSQQRLHILGQYINDLRLDGSHWTDPQLTDLLPHIPRLKHLSLNRGTRITNQSFRHLPRHCRQLTSLQLDSPRLTQGTFSDIGQFCHQLCDLEWNIWNNQSAEWLEMLIFSCPLERLRIHFGFVPLTEKTITIVKHFDHLTRLHITHETTASTKSLLLAPTPHPPPTTTTTTTAVSNSNTTTTAPLWPKLTTLILSPGSDIDDRTLVPFIQTHPHLKELVVTESKHLTNASLDAMILWLPVLTRVTLTGHAKISQAGVIRLARHCRCLEYVAIYCGVVFPYHYREPLGRDCLVLYHWVIEKLRQDARGRKSTNNRN